MRGSDPDAAVYYLARMLYAGEDIKFIARRIMICAAEDVGPADPQALQVAVAASLAAERIGLPGGTTDPFRGGDLRGDCDEEQFRDRGDLCHDARSEGASGDGPDTFTGCALWRGIEARRRDLAMRVRACDFRNIFHSSSICPDESAGRRHFYEPSGNGYEETDPEVSGLDS